MKTKILLSLAVLAIQSCSIRGTHYSNNLTYNMPLEIKESDKKGSACRSIFGNNSVSKAMKNAGITKLKLVEYSHYPLIECVYVIGE